MGFDAGITFCYTRDLKATSEFYERVLGLELALDQGGDIRRIPAIVSQEQVLIRLESEDRSGKEAAGIRILGKQDGVTALDIPELQGKSHCVHDGVTKRSAVAGPDPQMPMCFLVQDFIVAHSNTLVTPAVYSF